MSASFKIAASSWTARDEASLDSFSTTAATVVSNMVDYPLLGPEATLLTSAANAYHVAYSRHRQFGGTNNREVKDVAKAALGTAHQAVATKLEETADDNVEYLTKPGYYLDQKGGVHSLAKVPPPWFKKVVSANARGRVKFILGAAKTREIKGIIGRCSIDNGVTWKNGITVFKLNFTLDDQPSGKGVLYQFMFTATNARDSDWSAPIYVDVF